MKRSLFVLVLLAQACSSRQPLSLRRDSGLDATADTSSEGHFDGLEPPSDVPGDGDKAGGDAKVAEAGSPADAGGVDVAAGPEALDSSGAREVSRELGAFDNGILLDGEGDTVDATPSITYFDAAVASAIAAGADGNLWLAAPYQIVRVTTDGVVTMFSTSERNEMDGTMVLGADGNLWMAGSYSYVLQITPGGAFRRFSLPQDVGVAYAITPGSDGNLWVSGSDYSGNVIARLTTNGDLTSFPLSKVRADFLALGPDGDLWYCHTHGAGKDASTGDALSAFGRISTTGAVTPVKEISSDTLVKRMVMGPDGNLWFTHLWVGSLYRMNVAGEVVEFRLAVADTNPYDMTAGPDGNLWFTYSRTGSGGAIGRLTMTGSVTEIPLGDIVPRRITAGPDGNLWFTTTSNKVGRISLPLRG
jgi:virginiamycin B lyase